MHHEDSGDVKRIFTVAEVESSQMKEYQGSETFGNNDVSDVFSWREDDQKIGYLLLDPKDPFIVREQDGLEADCEGHGHGQEEVLAVDEGKEIGKRDCDDHDQNEIGLIIGQHSYKGIL